MDALSTEDLIQAERVLYHHFFCYVKSMALNCAVNLGIPNAIHLRGGSATLSNLISDTGLHPSRLPYVQRLMNVLTISSVFTASHPPATCSLSREEAVLYKLTAASRLLVAGDDKLCGMSPLLHFLVRPLTITPFFGMHAWFKDEQTASKSFFEMAHGCDRWEMTGKDAEDNTVFNEAMVADSQLVMEIFLRQAAGGEIFSGLSSLVDVGGGVGAASAAITRAFPHIKCTVLDLPQVVSQAQADPQGSGTVNFVAGDMFKFIPPADAVLLRCVLHCWGDDDCIKILRNCKDAIPAREDGGKVIIIDSVMGSGPQDDTVSKEAQALYDLYMMYINGVERGENEWKKIFQQAGFSDYKIVSGLGIRSAIVVYP